LRSVAIIRYDNNLGCRGGSVESPRHLDQMRLSRP
jgi:hypothetical protein